jgi:uncharacterized membrane protein YbjE (DUF340 family)
MEFIKELVAKALSSQEGLIYFVILVMIAVNVALTSAKKFLGWLHKKTESKLDDRAFEIVSQVLRGLSLGLEFISANSEALPAKAKAELDKGEWKEVPASEALKVEEKKE